MRSNRTWSCRTRYGLHNGMLPEAIRAKLREQEWIPTELLALPFVQKWSFRCTRLIVIWGIFFVVSGLIETISGQNIPTSLKRALREHSLLIGSAHIVQHSCCSNKTCSTSINARLGLILEVSNDDNDDICLGAGLTATRTIQPGEQIYVSYASDSSIEDTWEDIFKSKLLLRLPR